MRGLYTLPRHTRITRRAEYLRVFREGRKQVGRAFVCYVAPGGDQGRRIGYVVSRKVGGSVVRNRVKRTIREVFRTHRTTLARDAHVVVVARRASAALSFRQSEQALRRLFRREEECDG